MRAIELLSGVLAFAALVGSAAPARADTDDDQFLQIMAAYDIVSDAGPAGLLHLAHTVCNDRAQGYSDLITATRVNNANLGLGLNRAGFIVSVAEHIYCPQFSSPVPPN